MTDDFTCKQLVFILNGTLNTWIWVFVVGWVICALILVFGYFRLRADKAQIFGAIRAARMPPPSSKPPETLGIE